MKEFCAALKGYTNAPRSTPVLAIFENSCRMQVVRKVVGRQVALYVSLTAQHGQSRSSIADVYLHCLDIMNNRFTALEAAQNEVTPEDLWKGTKTVLL